MGNQDNDILTVNMLPTMVDGQAFRIILRHREGPYRSLNIYYLNQMEIGSDNKYTGAKYKK